MVLCTAKAPKHQQRENGFSDYYQIFKFFKILLMMKHLNFLLLLILINPELIAQVVQPAGKMNVNTAPGGIVEEVLFDEIPETKGSYYLSDQWLAGNVYLKNGQFVENKPLKYDLQAQVIRIRFNGVIKALKAPKIQRFEFAGPNDEKRVFLNTDQFKDEGILPTGFFNILLEGALSLYSMTTLQLIKANYAPTHDAGEKSDSYLKSDHFYFGQEANVFKIPKNRNKALKFFEGRAEVVKSFIQEHKLGFKKEQDLKRIVNFYNSLE